ncbi:DUF484 family protein [Snodgrassella sp. B3800]|uniref:DUF484 family protein n=1 Tax=Snodgrassella sp. B3800 TaxID=2818039 RepID=UPI00226A1FD6|nr:DUF484 family protein [Snodgrassella sp. B3800]MCX8747260.1 DUF484 family protein [Snodgrassella sp. B3800]
MSIKEADVRAFLHAQPEWLYEHAAEFNLRPIESKIMSFQQGRMQFMQRKTEKMASQLVQMLGEADANHTLMAKFMAFDRRLLLVNTVAQWQRAIHDSLKNEFVLPDFALKIVTEAPKSVRIPASLMADDKVKAVAKKLNKPICGNLPVVVLRELLPVQPRLESFLQLPLRWQEQTLAILIVGHENEAHFTSDMATEWVNYMAENMAVVLARLLKLVR